MSELNMANSGTIQRKLKPFIYVIAFSDKSAVKGQVDCPTITSALAHVLAMVSSDSRHIVMVNCVEAQPALIVPANGPLPEPRFKL